MPSKQTYAARLAAGQCPTCGGEPDVGTKMCASCKRKRAAAMSKCYAKRVAQRLCPSCGRSPLPDAVYCEVCSVERQSATRQFKIRNRVAGICIRSRCSAPVVKHRLCEQHLVGHAQRLRDWINKRRKKIKQIVVEHYGGECACCGEKEVAFLTVDHINNDGAEHRKEVKHTRMYVWLRQNGYPPGYQILCWNCNCGRAINGGICPHKKPV